MEDSTDRMSQLPEFINHHIMSFLDTPKERVRMSVLSKYWFGITASFPILDFDIRKFEGFISFDALANGNLLDKFFKYVEYTTSRFFHQNVSAHTFKLITSLWDVTQEDIVDKCLELILIKGVQVLVIDIRVRYLLPLLTRYRVSNKLVSASSLTSLTIHGCELPSSMMVDTIKFKSLKLLTLKTVPIDEKMITHLTTSCPLLEELTLKIRGGDISRLCVYGLQNLQRVKFFAGVIDRIDIEAPNLCFLQVMHMLGSAPCFNVASCKKLTTVFYCGLGYPSPTWKGLADFSSNFPYLETLFLDLYDRYKSLKLSSHSLRTFVLHSDCDFEDLDIDTPNLLSFEYTFSSYPPFSMNRDSVSSKSRMKCNPLNFVDALWFKKLRRFLDKKVRFKELKLCISAIPSKVEELWTIQLPPFELDHIDLEPCVKNLSSYLAVVDSVLWCCRPQSLTLESSFPSINFEEWSHIVKFTYEKLLLQEDEGQTNIHVVMSSSSNAKKHFNDMTSLLTALSRDRPTRPIITFIKEEVLQEAGYEIPSVWMEGSTHTQSTSLQKV